jgi:putative Holliday junction resolvase
MRIMAIDPGTARHGVAASDTLGMIATPLPFLPASGKGGGIDALVAAAVAMEASLILVGYPLNMDGTVGPRAKAAERLAEELRQRIAVEVRLSDERLSSVEAHELLREAGRDVRKQKGLLDSAAAAVMLQRYLDRNG